MTVALGFGVTATIGPVVDPPLAVIVCVFVSTSGLVVGVVVSKIISTLSLGFITLSMVKITYVTGTTLTIPNLAIPVGTSTLTVSGIYTN